MFADLSVEKLLVLALLGLFILGPERLPAALTWTARTMRRVRSFADDAQRSLQRELGPEVAQLHQPLSDLREPLQQLRGLTRPGEMLGRSLLSTPSQPYASSPGPGPGPHHRQSAHQMPAPAAPAPFDPDTT